MITFNKKGDTLMNIEEVMIDAKLLQEIINGLLSDLTHVEKELHTIIKILSKTIIKSEIYPEEN